MFQDVSLAPEIEDLVARALADGRYRTREEVLRAALLALADPHGTAPDDLPFLAGGGEMGRLIAAYPWETTPLGPLRTWPQSLRSAVSLALNARFPTYLTWGESLTGLYNDAYRPLLGDKPEALGRPFAEVWAEAWPVIGPIARRALEGESSYFEDLPITLERAGAPELVHATFSYSPVRDESGAVRGVLCTVQETTDAVRTRLALEASESRLRLAIEAGRMAVFEHDGATDSVVPSPELKLLLGYDADAAVTTEMLRGHYPPGERDRLAAVARQALESGERFVEAELRLLVRGEVRWFLLRAEMILDAEGFPRRTIGVLMDINQRKRAELELKEREADLTAAMDAGALAPFDFDHRTGRFRHSPRLNALYGLPPDHLLTLQDVRARYHPDDVAAIHARRDSHEADPSQRAFEWTLRFLLPDGRTRWLTGLGEYLRDENGRIVRSRGVVMDVTERKRWEEQQKLLVNELNHRVKNTLATVQSLAMQSFRKAGGDPGPMLAAFQGRLVSLAAAHDLLTRQSWEDADLGELVRTAVSSFEDGPDRFAIGGPAVRVEPQVALSIGMALHELSTNAAKYGALTSRSGRVEVSWEAAGVGRVRLRWRETGGPEVARPARLGFGTRLIRRHLAADLGGDARLDFHPDGVVCEIEFVALPRP